jgi:hypothetical protein
MMGVSVKRVGFAKPVGCQTPGWGDRRTPFPAS